MGHRVKRHRFARAIALYEGAGDAYDRAVNSRDYDRTYALYEALYDAYDTLCDLMLSPTGRRLHRRFERESLAETADDLAANVVGRVGV